MLFHMKELQLGLPKIHESEALTINFIFSVSEKVHL